MTQTINDVEAINRAHKAAHLAKTALSHGATPEHLCLPPVRTMILSLTPRPRVGNKRNAGRWSDASEQTWAEAQAILTALRS